MARGIACHACTDGRMLGRNVDTFVPVSTKLDDGNTGTQYSIALLVQLWCTPCSCPVPFLEVNQFRAARPAGTGGRVRYDPANIISDKHILGSFFWGGDDTGAFNLHGMQAASVIHSYYQALME
jgi:hypothetical protein